MDTYIDRDEEPILCNNCGCWYKQSPTQPEERCSHPVCSCHQPYWDTIPESLKREMWGGR